jgi:nicotinamide mononucleotide (NMN) deamidase PncC
MQLSRICFATSGKRGSKGGKYKEGVGKLVIGCGTLEGKEVKTTEHKNAVKKRWAYSIDHLSFPPPHFPPPIPESTAARQSSST